MRSRRAIAWLAAGVGALLAAGPAGAALPAGGMPTVRADWPHGTYSIKTRKGTVRFAIDVADTAAREQQGLMDVRIVPAGYGMLFPVEPPRIMRMWMHDTYVPLDMLFIDQQGRIACIRADARPLSDAVIDCPQPATAVLEIAGGEARRLGIRVGDRVANPPPRA